MQFDESFIEQVRSTVSIVDLVSNYVNLRKSGQNHAGLCPFHEEKTPSFLVSESKQIFKCFGCGEGGDVFSFVTRMENLSFPEAVRFLAERTGLPLPESSPSERAASDNRERLLEVMKRAQQYFRSCLERTDGEAALRYLEERQIKREVIDMFGIGFAPPGNRLLRLLEKERVETGLALRCGLLKETPEGRLYDSFRSRVMFPIRDLSGRPIAFGGRILGEGIPKYLNSAETPLYNKSNNLYGLDVSRAHIRDRGFAVLVEGYFDCVVPFQFGFTNVVASLGTSLTSQQVKILGRYTRNVVVSYDPDSAGVAATVRSIELFLAKGFRVNIVDLPEGGDPDTFLRENGAEAYSLKLKDSKGCLDFVLERLIKGERDPFSPKGKQDIVEKIVPFLIMMPDNLERAEYVSRIASRMRIAEDLLRREIRKRPGRQEAKEKTSLAEKLSQPTSAETTLLSAVFKASLQEKVVANIDEELFEGLVTQRIFQKIAELREPNREIDILYLRDLLEDEQDLRLLDSIGIQADEVNVDEGDVAASFGALRKKQYELLSRRIQAEIAKEEAVDSKSSRIDELLARKEEIRKKIELDLL
jgi:DNA primase